MSIAPDLSDPMDDSKGGKSSWGRWQQNKGEDVVMYLPLPAGTRGRDVQAKITSATLQLAVRGKTIAGGSFFAKVLADECEWQLDNGELVVTLRKADEGWWDRVLDTDEPVDASRFDEEEFVLGKMEEHQHDSMRDHVARMLGEGTQGSASLF